MKTPTRSGAYRHARTLRTLAARADIRGRRILGFSADELRGMARRMKINPNDK